MLIDAKSLPELRDLQLEKWQEMLPNANVSPDSMIYIDASVLAEVLYLVQQDSVTLVNNAFLAYATGDELSNLGLDRGLPRNDAEPAEGEARFSRDILATSNYTIPEGTLISTQPDGTGGIVVFKTTDAGILYGVVSTPTAPLAGILLTGGAIGTGTYYYKITAISGDNKETNASPKVTVVIASGTTNVISLTRTSVANAISYNVYISSDDSTYEYVANSVTPTYLDTVGNNSSADTPPVSNETGNLYVDIAIEAQVAGVSGNLAPSTITQFIDKPLGIDAVTNPAETEGGSDAEDDDAYRTRIKAYLSSNTGKTTVSGYKKTAEEYPGVRLATVTVGSPTNNIIITIIADNLTGVPSAELVDEVQAYMDLDDNRAVCDEITVQAPSIETVNYTVDIIEKSSSVSEAELTALITAAVASYLPTIPIGGTVYVVNLANVIHDVEGVIDFDLTVPSANIDLGTGEIAVAGTPTITF